MQDEDIIFCDGNLIVNSEDEFKNGQVENIRLNDNGEIELNPENLQGIYRSTVIKTEKFNELIASWNVNTPEGTHIEVSVQTRVDDEWTIWYSYGKWSTNRDSGSIAGQVDKLGKLSIDTLEILRGQYADALRYRVELEREDKTTEVPSVKSVYMTLKIEEDLYVFDKDIDYLVELDVPERSQMIVPEIGNRICSPTSLAMVLEYYGEDMATEEVSAGVLDNDIDIYGNWSYNASYAGSKGLDSYVARFESVDRIKEKIADGVPVVASINTKSEDTLTGAPQTYPSGHLIVIRGFKVKDGEEYVIVNDPASPEVEKVRREYKTSDFENAWNNVVYIISEGVE